MGIAEAHRDAVTTQNSEHADQGLRFNAPGRLAGPSGRLEFPPPPSLDNVLERMRAASSGRAQRQAHPEQASQTTAEPDVQAVQAGSTPDGTLLHQPETAFEAHAVAHESADVTQVVATATGSAAVAAQTDTVAANSVAPLATAEADLADTTSHLPLHTLTREVVRARLLAAAQARHHRSAYELVFLMLAFAVTVLLVSAPLVDILLALHGRQP